MLAPDETRLLTETFRKVLTSTPAAAVDAALTGAGWPDLLIEHPDAATALVFRLLGETGTHAPLLNDVLLHAAGQPLGGTMPLPGAGGRWLLWDRTGHRPDALDPDLPLHPIPTGAELPLAPGRRALSWWLLGTGHAMLTLARTHALTRTQFGRPLSSFQAVRHRLAESLVALEAAEATLSVATDELGALLAKAATGQAALTTARHCQQVLAGIGFTAEHDLHRHVRRTLVLDGLLGSSRELTREAGALIRTLGHAPRLAQLT
ncbi:acyl-CoA dehydrogenase family protein [Nocardia sp. NPDC057668]|uniref:acyl-CoA dehydrogenase family protein n=1 Tax=Nocardia sp. NPDC057668 TaxID=3346202 RepID=UPI00366F825C